MLKEGSNTQTGSTNPVPSGPWRLLANVAISGAKIGIGPGSKDNPINHRRSSTLPFHFIENVVRQSTLAA